MIDRNYREAPRNICLDEKSSIEAFKKLTNTTKSSSLDDKVAFIAQLSHPGRQATIASTFKSVGPSSIKLELPVSFFLIKKLQKLNFFRENHLYLQLQEL